MIKHTSVCTICTDVFWRNMCEECIWLVDGVDLNKRMEWMDDG